jgi:hypothetical protein
MRKLLLFAALLVPAIAAGQGVASPPNVALQTVNGVTRPIPNATITVCAANASGIPCATALVGQIWANSALTSTFPGGNPFTSDANGNYQFFGLPGQYTVTVTASGYSGYSYQVTLAPAPAAGTITLSGGAGSHTFVTAYTAAPVCTATDTTGANAVKVTSTTAAVSISGTGTDSVAWICTPANN